MVRSPKTGRELRGERGHRAPPLLRSFYRTVFGFFGTDYPEEDPGYAEELCFHHENGVAT
ncbi:MAG: hypothetical protein SVU32_04600 [Candidatus Nanohaloarchaea archaeon]|nr:hypothetical protein [Candidatus Nanohaloarchaea archaeon]